MRSEICKDRLDIIMHNVHVTLINDSGLRLTMNITVPVRNTPYENAARDEAEKRANADSMHSKYGPWIATNSGFSY